MYRSSLLWTHAGAAYCDLRQRSRVKHITPWCKDLAVQVVSNKSEERKPERHVASVLLQHRTFVFDFCGLLWLLLLWRYRSNVCVICTGKQARR